MLGGAWYIALIRFAISLGGTVLLFSLMSESRFGGKKTAFCYVCYGAVLIAATCIWYAVDRENCVRVGGICHVCMFCRLCRLYEPRSCFSVIV